MVRTKADLATSRVSGAKAPRKFPPAAANAKKSNCGSGGNPYCPRETPTWQKEITKFFTPVQNSEDSDNGEGVSGELNNKEQVAHHDTEQNNKESDGIEDPRGNVERAEDKENNHEGNSSSGET